MKLFIYLFIEDSESSLLKYFYAFGYGLNLVSLFFGKCSKKFALDV